MLVLLWGFPAAVLVFLVRYAPSDVFCLWVSWDGAGFQLAV